MSLSLYDSLAYITLKKLQKNSVDVFLYRKVLSRIKEQREKINLYLNKNVPTEVSNDIVRYGDPRFNVTNKMRLTLQTKSSLS